MTILPIWGDVFFAGNRKLCQQVVYACACYNLISTKRSRVTRTEDRVMWSATFTLFPISFFSPFSDVFLRLKLYILQREREKEREKEKKRKNEEIKCYISLFTATAAICFTICNSWAELEVSSRSLPLTYWNSAVRRMCTVVVHTFRVNKLRIQAESRKHRKG